MTKQIYDELYLLSKFNNLTMIIYHDLEIRKNDNSNNILIICKDEKELNEKFNELIRNNEDKIKKIFSSSKKIIFYNDINIIFKNMNEVINNKLVGLRFKKYYFSDLLERW